jgi:hypothetical protein
MFRDAEGVTHVYFADMDYTVTTGYYSVLMKIFWLALRKDQLIYFIHDNVLHVSRDISLCNKIQEWYLCHLNSFL